MKDDKASIAAAIITFQNIVDGFIFIGQHMLDNGVDYRYIRRLQTINLKLEELINLMKGELK